MRTLGSCLHLPLSSHHSPLGGGEARNATTVRDHQRASPPRPARPSPSAPACRQRYPRVPRAGIISSCPISMTGRPPEASWLVRGRVQIGQAATRSPAQTLAASARCESWPENPSNGAGRRKNLRGAAGSRHIECKVRQPPAAPLPSPCRSAYELGRLVVFSMRMGFDRITACRARRPRRADLFGRLRRRNPRPVDCANDGDRCAQPQAHSRHRRRSHPRPQ